MPSLLVNDINLAYDTEGSGPPIVWISGTGNSRGTWRAQVEHFRASYTCVTYDLRGTGRSDAPVEQYTVAMMAQDTAGLIDALGIESAHFVGFSLGSAIVQELALARPDLVQSAVLLSTWSSSAREHHIRRHFSSRLVALQEAPIEVFRAFAFWMWSPTIVDNEPDLVERTERLFLEESSAQPRHAYENHFIADLGHETRDRLTDIRCPTLVLYGAEDLITLPSYNRTVAELIPDARIREIPVAGHLAWAERPTAVNEAIDEFLSSLVADPEQGVRP